MRLSELFAGNEGRVLFWLIMLIVLESIAVAALIIIPMIADAYNVVRARRYRAIMFKRFLG